MKPNIISHRKEKESFFEFLLENQLVIKNLNSSFENREKKRIEIAVNYYFFSKKIRYTKIIVYYYSIKIKIIAISFVKYLCLFRKKIKIPYHD